MLNHDSFQAAISARLDGEAYELDDAVLDTHLANCPDCRAYADKAAALSSSLSFVESNDQGMAPPKELSEVILAGVEPEWRRASNARQIALVVVRLFLAVLGLAFLVWGVLQVVSASGIAPVSADGSVLDPSADPERGLFLMEGAAVRFGLASGLFFAAWRPSLAPGLLPVTCTMFAFAAGFAVRDIALGTAVIEQVYFLLGSGLAAIGLGWAWAADKGYVLRGFVRQLNANPN
ncbi:zf-HC2 domain-containing protein [Corynebacterium camporealensis]